MPLYPYAEIGANNLYRNRTTWGEKLGIGETPHTPPDLDHYPDPHEWDEAKSAIVFARAGGKFWLERAGTGLKTILKGQWENGFIPNIPEIVRKGGRAFDPDRRISLGKDATSTKHTQPPVLGTALAEIITATRKIDAASAYLFEDEVYPQIKKSLEYFDIYRSNSPTDKLIGVIHPHETGRDSDPTFDGLIKPWRLKRSGADTLRIIDLANTAINYGSTLAHGYKLRKVDWDTEKAREIFWVNDVMMNCLYVNDLYEMARIAKNSWRMSDSEYFYDLAQTVEQQILDKMWFKDARNGKGAFYALDAAGKPIKEITVSNLFPLLLPNLREKQLESLLNLMDSSFFNVPYPLPCVATDSDNYDPHYKEAESIWHNGSTWISPNFFVERGLEMQAGRPDLQHNQDLIRRCRGRGYGLIVSSLDLLNRFGVHEFYNPETGEGQRKHVRNFGWSNLGYVMLKSA